MTIIFTPNGVRIGRDATDKPIRKESTLVYRITKAIPNAHRFNPSRYGLTDSRLGFYVGFSLRSAKEIYWHGNYMIENARKAFNDGTVFFNKA